MDGNITLAFFNQNEYDVVGCHMTYFKNVLFKNYKITIKLNYNDIVSHTIFIIWRSYERFMETAKKFNKQNIKFGSIHIGREKYEPHKIKWYKYAEFVIKKGYNPQYLNISNVHYMPMGYKIYNTDTDNTLDVITKQYSI